jgi:ArsR family transcriptional regulator, arsenate/arsenite/antimonite-responsive transcriptional repressor
MESKPAVRSLAALAQETRLAVYRLLVQQGPSGMAAGEIAAQLALPPATLSFHLKELAHAGLVTARQDGRFIFYAADFDAMNALLAFLTENCCAADCGPACAPATACKPSNRSAPRPAESTQRAAQAGRARNPGVKP